MIKNKNYFNKNLSASFDGVFDWDYLKGAFYPTKIEPTDIDAIIERNNRFLIFETKNSGAVVPLGQQITLRALHSLGCVTIFYLEGKEKESISKFFVFYPKDKNPIEIDLLGKTPHEIVLNYTREWFLDANKFGSKTKI